MIENLKALLTTLKANPRLLSYNEDQTKMAVVQPIMRRLGWDIENVDEVTPEFSVERRRVDYALRINNRSAVFIEAKKPGEDLEDQNHQEQLLDYSFREAVDIAILTNGITWAFYLPRSSVDWKSRKFYTIDIVEQDLSDVAVKFIDLLSKSNIGSGKSLQNAELIHKGKLKKRAIEDAIPEAWNRIIGEPDPALVELIAERTERVCSFKPEIPEVSRFLKSYEGQFLLLPRDETPPSSRHPHLAPGKSFSPEPPDGQKISQDALIPHIVTLLKKHGGGATKEQVENEIYSMFKSTFDLPWYQQTVSSGIPRWQHNVAWAKERAKKRGLIKPPNVSGRGYWELTEKGRGFS
jgi:hypothetical protein